MNKFVFWTMYYTITRREITRILRIWPQTIVPPVITMTLYFLIFGKVVGSRIGTFEAGFTYMEYIVPGLIIMSVILNSYNNVVSSFFGIRFVRSIEELLVSPCNSHIIILGYITGGIFRSFAIGLVVSIVAYAFNGFDYGIHNFFLVVIGFFFCSALFALGGLVNAVFSQKFDDTMIFPTFILTPLIYLGGVFFSLQSLPGIWSKVALFNPLFYIVDFIRYGFLGVKNVNPYISISIIILFTVLLYYFVHYLISRGVRLKV